MGAEHRLAVPGENLRQLHAAGALNLAVELHEWHGQRLGGELAQRGLAGAAQADQRDASLCRSAGLAEPLGDQAPRLGKLRRRQALQLMQGERQVHGTLGRVAHQRGGLDAERLGDLAQHQKRGIAGPALQLRQVALGHPRSPRQRLARHAAAGPRQPHALAHPLEVGLVRRRRPAPGLRCGVRNRGHAVRNPGRHRAQCTIIHREATRRQKAALQREQTCSMMQAELPRSDN